MVEHRQESLEAAIRQADKDIRAKEEELISRIAAAEERLSTEIGQQAEVTASSVRKALGGTLDLLSREEERRAVSDEKAEHRAAVAERTWRGELLAVYKAAEEAVRSHGKVVAARADDLTTCVSGALAGIMTPEREEADAAAALLEELRRAIVDGEARIAVRVSEVRQRSESQLFEQTEELTALGSAVSAAAAAAADERQRAEEACERLRLQHERTVDEIKAAVEASHMTLSAEIRESDDALARASGALNDAMSALRAADAVAVSTAAAATAGGGGASLLPSAEMPTARSVSSLTRLCEQLHGQVEALSERGEQVALMVDAEEARIASEVRTYACA